MTSDRKRGNCPACEGTGAYVNSFSRLRRCGACKGTGGVPEEVAQKSAGRDMVLAALGALDELDNWDGRLAFSLLRDQEPERYAKACMSAYQGRAHEVADRLVAYYREKFPR